jgi:hypothetical protein
MNLSPSAGGGGGGLPDQPASPEGTVAPYLDISVDSLYYYLIWLINNPPLVPLID